MKTKVIERLSDVLLNGVDVHRCAAARALGELGDPGSKDVLIKALLDEDADVRTDAAAALSALKDPASAPKLMENLLGDPESFVKKAAISTLVAMQYKPVIPYLRALTLSRAEDKIAWDEGEFYTDEWDSWDDIQMASIKGLGEFGDVDAVDDIVTAMNDEMGQDLSEVGLTALAKMGEAGAFAIIDEYGKGDLRRCRRIVRAVSASDNPHLDALRAGLLQDSEATIRALALETLEPGDSDLVDLFSDEDENVRAAVVKHAGAQNLDVLAVMIADPSAMVREELFKIIAAHPDAFSDENLVEAVQKAIAGEPKAAKQAALALIALKGPKVVKGLTHVLGNEKIPREFRVGIIESFVVAGNVAVPALLSAAGDADRQLRLASLTALSEIAANDPEWPNEAGEGLLLALGGELVAAPEEEVDEDPVESEAPEVDAEELAEINDEIDAALPLVSEKVETLSTLDAIKANVPDAPQETPEEVVLSEEAEKALALTKTRKFAKRKVSWETAVAPHLDVQQFSARLLGAVVNEDTTTALIAALEQDVDDETLDAILFSLAKHGEITGKLPATLLGRVEELIDAPESTTRVLAIRVFGWLTGDTIEGRLEELLNSSDGLVRVEALQALDHRGVADEVAIAALSDPYIGMGIAAARALARHRGDAVVNDLVTFAGTHDGTYRRDIGRLFGQYAPKAGAAALLNMLNDETKKTLWLVAIDALAELYQTSALETVEKARLVA